MGLHLVTLNDIGARFTSAILYDGNTQPGGSPYSPPGVPQIRIVPCTGALWLAHQRRATGRNKQGIA